MSHGKVCELRIPSLPNRLKIVRALVSSAAEQAGCGPEVTFEIVVAVNEACMNVMQHSYRGDEDGEIILQIFNNGRDMVVELLDYAEAVDVNSVKPRDLDDIRPGGLGTHFIREVMDGFQIGRTNDGRRNYQRMTKTIA